MWATLFPVMMPGAGPGKTLKVTLHWLPEPLALSRAWQWEGEEEGWYSRP